MKSSCFKVLFFSIFLLELLKISFISASSQQDQIANVLELSKEVYRYNHILQEIGPNFPSLMALMGYEVPVFKIVYPSISNEVSMPGFNFNIQSIQNNFFDYSFVSSSIGESIPGQVNTAVDNTAFDWSILLNTIKSGPVFMGFLAFDEKNKYIKNITSTVKINTIALVIYNNSENFVLNKPIIFSAQNYRTNKLNQVGSVQLPSSFQDIMFSLYKTDTISANVTVLESKSLSYPFILEISVN